MQNEKLEVLGFGSRTLVGFEKKKTQLQVWIPSPELDSV